MYLSEAVTRSSTILLSKNLLGAHERLYAKQEKANAIDGDCRLSQCLFQVGRESGKVSGRFGAIE